MMVLWAVSLVIFLGLLGMIFDMGRLGTTQAELQSYADSVALAAAAELDGRADALTRARAAAETLITDTQTFGTGTTLLSGDQDITLTFYKPNRTGRFERTGAHVTTTPAAARFVDVQVADRDVPPGLGAVFASLSGTEPHFSRTSARAAATFEQEACNVAPVAACLPLDLDTNAAIGHTLELDATVNLDRMLPGNLSAVTSATQAVEGLGICAGLLGRQLTACLTASRRPETACTGRGGLELAVNVDGSDLLNAINTRFGETAGIASALVGDAFSGAPNILQGTLNGGICEALPERDDAGLPGDDCLSSGSCSIVGDGNWQAARTAYVETYYNGEDPFPAIETRFDFYQAEIAASGQIGGSAPDDGGLIGGLLDTVDTVVDGLTGQMCAPQASTDTERRLMVIAALDCTNVDVAAGVSAPVTKYFEAFALGPARDGTLNVEITACLGNGCMDDGRGNLDTDIRDVVRLVE